MQNTAGAIASPPATGEIELDGVGRRYEIGGVTVTALEDVNLRVEPGEFIVVLGPSGSGKTTLLNMIGALDSPTEGRIRIAGRDIANASRSELFRFRRHTVSFIFQTFNLFPALSALENVEFGADVAGRGAPRQLAAETLERVGLGHRLEHFPNELSGGEQQRVAIARGLATGNPILLADEHPGELDFRTGVRTLELLHQQTHVAASRRPRTGAGTLLDQAGRRTGDAPPARTGAHAPGAVPRRCRGGGPRRRPGCRRGIVARGGAVPL